MTAVTPVLSLYSGFCGAKSDARYNCGRVVTSSISFVSVQARKLIHSAAPPFPKKSGDFSGALFSVSYAVLSEHRSCPGVSPERRCASSTQASYHSPRRKRQVSLIPLRLLSPQNLRFCGDPIFRRGVMAQSYPVRTVIQLSFEAVPHSLFRANRKSRFTQHLAERIEIPFRSKKLCKSALLQSRSLFVRRPVNRLKTLGRRRHLIAAEALAAAQARRSPWHEPRKICASRIFSCVLPQWRAWVLYQGCENCQGKTGEV